MESKYSYYGLNKVHILSENWIKKRTCLKQEFLHYFKLNNQDQIKYLPNTDLFHKNICIQPIVNKKQTILEGLFISKYRISIEHNM